MSLRYSRNVPLSARRRRDAGGWSHMRRSPGTRGKMSPVRVFVLMLLCAGCLEDPVPLSSDLGAMCVGGLGGTAVVNVGKVGGLVLNSSPGEGVWESNAFTIGAPFAFSRLVWHPLAPYGRALAQDPPFDEGAVTLTNNIFLAHLDETSGN